jgi:dolichol-phosphate mannosyltransferase
MWGLAATFLVEVLARVLSVVIPFYNELGCLDPLLKRLHEALAPCGLDYEILIVDNGSSPDQHRQLLERCTDARLRVVVLSRNFGYQGALWAGLDHACGDPVVFMDADGEDPPELIPIFLEKWREGFEVVYGVRVSRRVGWFLNLCYKVFYRLLARWSSIHIPLDAGEFSLVGGQALRALRSFSDRTRMMRILRAWIGFRQAGVPYERSARLGGRSKFSMLGSFAFAWDGFVAATDLPVRLSIACALFCFAGGILGSVYYLLWYFFGKVKIPGFASLNITILFLFSMLFVCVAVLSRYVITLLDEARRRPPYLVSHEAGESPGEPASGGTESDE